MRRPPVRSRLGRFALAVVLVVVAASIVVPAPLPHGPVLTLGTGGQREFGRAWSA